MHTAKPVLGASTEREARRTENPRIPNMDRTTGGDTIAATTRRRLLADGFLLGSKSIPRVCHRGEARRRRRRRDHLVAIPGVCSSFYSRDATVE